jgi:hypothetical protein
MIVKKIVATFCAGLMAVLSVGTAAAPAIAAPITPLSINALPSGVETVQYRDRRPQRFQQQRFQRQQQRANRGYYRQGNAHYYNGHRGYRDRRPGYRQHNGVWFPPAAFIAGAIIGGAIANQPAARAPVRAGNAHVNWCQNQYRSYRVSDNTFQPYNGPRRACISPY